MTVTIGVVIPTFERVQPTVAAVDSALGQTALPDQVVVVDDGSSFEVRTELADLLKSREVTLVMTDHSGHPGRARNAGIEHLNTTHVAFLDSDDTWLPDKLALQGEVLAEGARATFSNARIAGTENTLLHDPSLIPTWLSLSRLLKANVICNSSAVVERRLIDQVGGVPSSYAVRGVEDYALWLRIAAMTPWRGVSEPLVDYHDEPATSIRGTKECAIPEETLVELDFVYWMQQTRRTWKPTGRIATRLFPRVLRMQARLTELLRTVPDGR